MIGVSHLTKTFGKLMAVQDVCFRVGRGEIFAFLGPNGAGKNTIVEILTTLLRPTSGTVRIDGLDTMRDAGEVRRRFGIVFQDTSLDGELTAYETMDFHGLCDLDHCQFQSALRDQYSSAPTAIFESPERVIPQRATIQILQLRF